MAIHSSGENGNRNASNGTSDFLFGDASKDTPLWKYGMLKSITWARALYIIQDDGGGLRKRQKKSIKFNILNDLFEECTKKEERKQKVCVKESAKRKKKLEKALVCTQVEQRTVDCPTICWKFNTRKTHWTNVGNSMDTVYVCLSRE